MYCLMEFCKMSFPIHFDFSLLAGIIIRPLFTTFCSCFLLSFSKKITFFMLGTWYCIRCFLSFFLGKNVFSHPLQLLIFNFSPLSLTFSTTSSSRCFITFLKLLSHSLNVPVYGVSSLFSKLKIVHDFLHNFIFKIFHHFLRKFLTFFTF